MALSQVAASPALASPLRIRVGNKHFSPLSRWPCRFRVNRSKKKDILPIYIAVVCSPHDFATRLHRRTTVTIAPIRTDPCAIVSLSRTVSFLSSWSLFCQKILGSNKISIAEKKVTWSQRTLEKTSKMPATSSHKPYPLKIPFFLLFLLVFLAGQCGLNSDLDFSATLHARLVANMA